MGCFKYLLARARSSWPSAASSSSASSTRRPRRTSTSGPRSRFLTGVLCIFLASLRWRRQVRSGPSNDGTWRRSRRVAPDDCRGRAHFGAYGQAGSRAHEQSLRPSRQMRIAAVRENTPSPQETKPILKTKRRRRPGASPLPQGGGALPLPWPDDYVFGSRRGRRVRGAFYSRRWRRMEASMAWRRTLREHVDRGT